MHTCLVNLLYVQTSFFVLYLITINGGGDAVQPRAMDPKKDLAVYGYGSVAWKERMEEWKKKQNEKLEEVKDKGGKNCEINGDQIDDPDLPK